MLRLMGVKRLAATVFLFPLLVGCAATAESGVAAVAVTSASPGADQAAVRDGRSRTGPVGDGGAGASCVETYSASTLVNRDFSFDGTVLAIGLGATNKPGMGELEIAAVTFRVNEWFKGGTGDTVAVDMGPPTPGDASQEPAYEEGTRLLVSGEPRWGGQPLDDAIAWSCGGFTRYYEPAVADAWRRATA